MIEKPDEQLGYLLTQVSFLKQRLVNAALKEIDITYIQFIILAGTLELGASGRMVTQQDISTERQLDKAMVSNVVKVLVDKKLMKREKHPMDKRAFVLELTREGEKKAVRGKEIAMSIDSGFFAGIDQDIFRVSLEKLLTSNSSRHEEQ